MEAKRENLPFTSANEGEEKNFQDPDTRNEKVTRISRLSVMLMTPNLKWNFIHISKANNEISFRYSFLLALMISRLESGAREQKEIPKVL